VEWPEGRGGAVYRKKKTTGCEINGDPSKERAENSSTEDKRRPLCHGNLGHSRNGERSSGATRGGKKEFTPRPSGKQALRRRPIGEKKIGLISQATPRARRAKGEKEVKSSLGWKSYRQLIERDQPEGTHLGEESKVVNSSVIRRN